METIYHEKQDGALCAQHCLNNILQDSYFTAVDLGMIARELDNLERSRLTAENPGEPERTSENMDDSGMFSVQVIEKALESFSLSLSNIESQEPESIQAKLHPESCNAFICNFEAHWIGVRKLGNQWFNLNSLLSFPELISDLLLSMYLTQLTAEGYTIFLVRGALPMCEADQLLQLIPVTQLVKPSLLQSSSTTDSTEGMTGSETPQALDEYEDMQAAIALSLAHSQEPGTSSDVSELTPEEMREQRIKRFDKQ